MNPVVENDMVIKNYMYRLNKINKLPFNKNNKTLHREAIMSFFITG